LVSLPFSVADDASTSLGASVSTVRPSVVNSLSTPLSYSLPLFVAARTTYVVFDFSPLTDSLNEPVELFVRWGVHFCVELLAPFSQ